jgi:DNA-binding response OmpR family regulator
MRPSFEARPKVLLVDDDEMLMEVMSAALEQQGYEFEAARTAAEALSKAYRIRPCLVLLDINLPDQSGYLVAAKLKLTKPTPKIIFVTAQPGGQSDRLASFVRADGVLHKPFAMGQLFAVMDRLLGVAHAA